MEQGKNLPTEKFQFSWRAKNAEERRLEFVSDLCKSNFMAVLGGYGIAHILNDWIPDTVHLSCRITLYVQPSQVSDVMHRYSDIWDFEETQVILRYKHFLGKSALHLPKLEIIPVWGVISDKIKKYTINGVDFYGLSEMDAIADLILQLSCIRVSAQYPLYAIQAILNWMGECDQHSLYSNFRTAEVGDFKEYRRLKTSKVPVLDRVPDAVRVVELACNCFGQDTTPVEQRSGDWKPSRLAHADDLKPSSVF